MVGENKSLVDTKDIALTETTQLVEKLVLDVFKVLFTRDTHVPGLWELPLAQLRVMNALGRVEQERPPTMGELAGLLGVALSTATQIVERIEKRGLVRREHSDPGDRRVVHIALTEPGLRLVEERRRVRLERLALVMAQLAPSEANALIDALTPLAAAARQVECADKHAAVTTAVMLHADNMN